MAKSGTRLKDIAVKTRFSVNTVSLALRDSDRIPDETRLKIKAVAESLNYLPNHVAKSLVSQETRTIGLILTDMQNPILTDVAQSVERKLAEHGYTTLIATSNNNHAEELRMIQLFRSGRVDGMLVFPFRHGDLQHISQLRKQNYPIVLLVGEPGAGIDTVSMDELSGACKAVSYLLSVGHTRIAFLDASASMGNREKVDGYRLAHENVKELIDDSLLVDPNGHGVENGYWAMSELCSRTVDFTAVFTSNDSLALGVLRYCSKHDIHLPRDMSLVGFDNIKVGAYATTALSTVSYNVERVASLSVDRVLNLISHRGELPEPMVTQIEPELLIRESSGPCAVSSKKSSIKARAGKRK